MLKKTFSGMMLILLLMGMLTLAINIQPVKASGTIYIRADGSIDPPTAPIQRNGDVYTFIDNIYEPNASARAIVIEKDNIVVDGAGYTLEGPGWGTATGIYLSERSNITIKNVKITRFTVGINLRIGCSNNNISGNSITNNVQGIYLLYSSSNTISRNNIMDNGDGIYVYNSSNTIYENYIARNIYGVYLHYSSSNTIYHNSFINNTQQAFIEKYSGFVYANVWDDGYPSGGNYWSDYNGTDLFSGPYQNDTGSDGMGDTPYVIDAYNKDRYPFMNPWIELPLFPIGTFVIPMDEKQNLLTTENVTIYGFIWSILDGGASIYRIIEPPDITLKTTTHPEGTVYSGGVILVMPTYGSIIEEKRLNFPNLTIDTLTEPSRIPQNQLFFIEKPTKILVIQGIWGHTEVTLDWMKIPYTLVTPSALQINATIIQNYDLVVDDCPGWWGSMPAHVVANFTTFASHGGEIVFTDIALRDLAQAFPGYINVVSNLDWTGNVSIHNPPFTGFPAEFPSQYPATFPQTTKIYTMGGGNIVDIVLNITEVRVLMDTSQYGGVNRTLAFYFPYGNGLVEGFAYHPQEQREDITGDSYSYVVSSIFYGNKFIHAIPTHNIAVTNVKLSKTVVGQSYSMSINVTVANQGDYTETFNITAYANTSIIATLLTNITLTSGNSTTLTLTWGTTGFAKGNYTISAYAWPVEGEIDTTDNTFIDGWIVITIVGDVNGDSQVDLKDVFAVALAFGSYPGHPRWNPNLDINNDLKVDLKDYYATVLNYGKTDP